MMNPVMCVWRLSCGSDVFSFSERRWRRHWWRRWWRRSGRCGSSGHPEKTPAVPSGSWRPCDGSENVPERDHSEHPSIHKHTSHTDRQSELLTIFSKTTDITAQTVKNAATTIMMMPTAGLLPTTDTAAIQPLTFNKNKHQTLQTKP